MTATRLAANAVPDYAINHLPRGRDSFFSGNALIRDGIDDAMPLDVMAAPGIAGDFTSIDIAPGELGSLLPEGGWAIVDTGDVKPAVGRVYWGEAGHRSAFRCLGVAPLQMDPLREGIAITAGATLQIQGRIVSYGRCLIDPGAATSRLTRLGRLKGRLRATLHAITPYWNRGSIIIGSIRGHDEFQAEGQVGFVELQWLGLHIEMQIGRAP